MVKHSYKLITLAIILTLSAVLVSAGSVASSNSVTFTVPFDFQIGNQKLEKGKYRVTRENQNAVLVESLDSNDAVIVLAGNSNDRIKTFDESVLTFNRYGERYFLREINSPTISAHVSKSRDEKKVEKSGYEKLAKVSIKAHKK